MPEVWVMVETGNPAFVNIMASGGDRGDRAVALCVTRSDAERMLKVASLEHLLARAYPFLTWSDEARGLDPALDAEFDGIVRDVEVAIQHLPDEKEA